MALDERIYRVSDLKIVLSELAIGAEAMLRKSRGNGTLEKEASHMFDAGISRGVEHAIERICDRMGIDMEEIRTSIM